MDSEELSSLPGLQLPLFFFEFYQLIVEHIDFTVYIKANKTHGEILAVLGNCSKAT